MSVLIKSSTTAFNSVTLLNDDEYYVFEIAVPQTVSAADATEENLIAADFSGSSISLDEIVYSPDTNTIEAKTTQNINNLDSFGVNLSLNNETFEVYPTISKDIAAEGIGLVNYGFYDRNGNPVYDISERIDLVFKATLVNASNEDILNRTFQFSKNASSEIVDEQVLSIPKGSSIDVEVVCDFELAYGDRITLY